MFCPECGKEINDGSKFCRYCGSTLSESSTVSVPPPTSTPSSGITDEDYHKFIVKNADKYIMKFKEFEIGSVENFRATWHWPAFFVPAFWLLYRKLYVWALIVFIIGFINAFLPPILPLIILSSIVNISIMIATGLSANFIYYKHVKKNITEIKGLSEPQRAILYVRSGGVNIVAVWIAIIVSIVIMAAAVVTKSARDQFGAVAISASTQLYGFSINHVSQSEAENAALDKCRTQSSNSSDCELVSWFQNGCAALATGDHGIAYGSGPDKNTAQQKALQTCGEHNSNCQVIEWACTNNKTKD